MRYKHYTIFEKRFNIDKLNEKSWDAIRSDNSSSCFAIENTIEEYEKNCIQNTIYKDHSLYIKNIIDEYNIKEIVSCGCGKGILEWWIKQNNPNTKIVCADYTENGLNKLKKVFINVDKILRFDIINDDYSIFDKNSCFLFYRVSTEFDFKTWKKIFYNYRFGNFIFN